MKEVPIFIFNGLLESGKTTMIRNLLQNKDLTNGRKILILQCEEGIEEFDEDELAAKNVSVMPVEKEELFTDVLFRRISREQKPDYVIVEYNGMWAPERCFSINYPRGWGIAEVMTMVDSSTFRVYMQNMRPILAAIFRCSDTVVFNRFEDDTQKFAFRSAVKAQNLQSQVVFEYVGGTVDANFDSSPFDLDADPVVIEDTDWGLWYFDAMENVSRYDGKNIRARVKIFRIGEGEDSGTIVGRLGMTCCEADQQFLGIIVLDRDIEYENEAWMMLDAQVVAVDGRMYGEDPEPRLPALRVIRMEKAAPPQFEVVSL